MFIEMGERQAEVVEALTESAADEDWTHAYLRSEIPEDSLFALVQEAFVVVREEGVPKRVSLRLEDSVGDAVLAMYRTYQKAGHGFSKLELLVHRDGPYRFDLGALESDEPEGGRRGRMERRFEQLVREEGL